MQRALWMLEAEWSEEKHPRDKGKFASAAGSGASKKANVGDKITVVGVGDVGSFDLAVKGAKDGKVQIGYPDSPHVIKEIPAEHYQTWVNDISGKVDVPPSGNKIIDAVSSGKADFLGKGDDGLVFKVGDKAVKVSTIVPFIPTNPGDRTPEQAEKMLADQTAISEVMRAAGVPGILPTEFISHGGKGFQVRPFVDIPEKLSRQQLDKTKSHLEAMHAAGFHLGDYVQVGLHDGQPVLFDVGKAGKLDGSPTQNKDRIDIDNVRLERLYEDNGHDINRHDPLGLSKDNLATVFQNVKAEIMKHDPDMIETQASSLAGARMLNSIQQRAGEYIAAIDAKVANGANISPEEDERYITAGELRRDLHGAIAKLSGYRPHEHVDEHPIAKVPIDMPLPRKPRLKKGA